MESLPDLVLCKIFDFLPTEEYLKLKLVNQKFFEVLQLNRFSRHVLLKIPSCRLHPNEEPWNFLIKSKRNFPSILVECIRLKGLSDSEEFWRKIGKHTIELELRNKIPAEIFIPEDFLTYFPNLNKLRVWRSIEVLNGIIFPSNIKSLHTHEHDFSKQWETEKFKNLRFFGTKWVLNIKRKESERGFWNLVDNQHGPWPPIQLPQFLQSRVEVAPVNFLNVKELQLSHISGIHTQKSHPISQKIDIFSKLANLRYLLIYSDVNGCFFVHKTVPFHSLNFFIYSPSRDSRECCDDCCNFFTISCPNITKLTVDQSLKVIQAVAKNNKLKELRCSSQRSSQLRMVDVIFPTLRTLYISGNLSLEGLTPSLHILQFGFVNSNDIDLEFLLKNFPNVKATYFYHEKFDESHLKLVGKYWKKLRIFHFFIRGDSQRHSKYASLAFKHIPTLLQFGGVTRWMVEENPWNYIF